MHLTAGQAHDFEGADALLPCIDAHTAIADQAFDADGRMIEPLQKMRKNIVILSKSDRKNKRQYDEDLYKVRHLIENFFAKLKQYRALAARYDKRAQNVLGAVYLASSIIWLN